MNGGKILRRYSYQSVGETVQRDISYAEYFVPFGMVSPSNGLINGGISDKLEIYGDK